MQFLKAGTAAVIKFGPFVDKTDGVTLKTDATTITDIDHATTGIFLSKNGADAAVRHQSVTASVADDYGMMTVTLDTTDTNTVGTLDVLFAKAATYLPVHKSFMVIPASLWDTIMVAQPTAAILKFFDKATPTGTVNSLPDAVAGANGGLPTTDGTKVSQTVDLTAGQSIACSDKTGFSLSSTGADLILKSSTFIQAIAAAINELATYGLTALNTLLVTTGIKAATIPAATLAADQHVIVDSGTVTTLTNAPGDSTGVTELLTRIPDATAGTAGGLPTVAAGGAKLAQTVDLTAGQSIAVSDKTGFALSATGADLILKSSTFVQAIVAAVNELATYGLTALNTLLVSTGIKTATTAAPADMALNSTVAKEATLGTVAGYLDTEIAAILADTNELQTNQGDWVTATGFSTHSAADVKTALEADGSKLDHLWEMTEDDAGVRRLTTNALEQAPSGGASAADIADAVWEEAIADHLDAGTTGNALNAAGSAGDPWSTAIPGEYGVGTAGKILGDNIDAAISSRSSHSAADVWAVTTRTLSSFGTLVADIATAVWGAVARTLTAGTNIILAKGSGITGFNDLSSADVTAAVPTAAEIKTAIEAEGSHLALIKAKTDKMTYTSGNDLDVNVQQINDVSLVGNGSTTPWGPA